MNSSNDHANPTTARTESNRLPEFVTINGVKFVRSAVHCYEVGGRFVQWPLAITVNDCVYWQERP